MDDLIVIILTLVLTIFAAINQRKKQKRQVPADETGEPDFWEEVLMGGKSESRHYKTEEPARPAPEKRLEPEPVYRKPQEKRPVRVSAASSNTNFFKEQKEGARNEEVLKYTGLTKTSGTDSAKEEPNETLLEDFSLRKAIIYAEIIQPKYF